MKLTKTQMYAAIAGVVIVVAALAVGGFLLGRQAESTSESDTSVEGDASAESSWTVEATGSVEPTGSTGTVEQPPVQQTQPSYKRYAHVSAIGGMPDNRFAEVDWFDILTDDAAKQYAQTHGMQAPANGILYVNETVESEKVLLSSTVQIVYKTGGVESLQMHNATVDQLTQWAAGNPGAMPEAMTNMWEITVVNGIATRIEMVVIAD